MSSRNSKKILERSFYDFKKILEKFLYLSKVDLPALFIANSPLKDKVWFDDIRLRKFFDYYRENEQPSLDALDETLVFCDPQTRFDLLGEPNNCRAFENHLQESFDSAWKEFRILSEYSEQHIQKQTRKTKVTVFPSARDLRWDEVSMVFVSDEVIKVRARRQLEEYRFDQIGFKDERTGDRPNRLWLFLMALAGNHGQVSWEDLSGFGMNAGQVHSNVKRLRKSLCEFMVIENDPFYPYREVNAYQARFTITGDAAALIDSADDDPESDLEAIYQADVNRLP